MYNLRGVVMLAGLVAAILGFIAWLVFGLNGEAAQAGLGFKGAVAGIFLILLSGVFKEGRK